MKTVATESAERLFTAGRDRAELALLNHPRCTDPQRAFASLTQRFALWRGGNSIGKSWGHAFDLVHYARGTHPWRAVPRGVRKLMVGGYSWAQMDPLMEKLWMMLPKGEIHPKLYYQPGQGIRGFKEPVIPFVAGPGKGSVIHLATYEQGPGRIMGWQGHRLSMDEPPPEPIYREAVPRLNSFRGELRLTFTPTPDSPPLEYLRKEVEEGRVHDMQTTYCQESVTVRGGLVPWAWKLQADIDEDIGNYAADERPMRRDGAWDPVVAGRWLERITEELVTDAGLAAGSWEICVAADHGTRPGRQSASLCAANDLGEYMLLDECVKGTVTSMEEDADGMLEMLARNGLGWEDVDHWVGDRATSDSYWGSAKSNQDLQRALAARLRMTAQEAAARGLRIHTFPKPRASVRRGVAVINQLAAKKLLRIHRRCERFLAGAREWKGDPQSPLKDPLDSARYGLMTLYDRQQVRGVGSHGAIQ